MTLFWKKGTKEKEAVPATNVLLLKNLRSFEEHFKQKVAEADTKTSGGCVSNLLSCVRSTPNKIPQNYKDIAAWLTKLATAEIQGDIDTIVLISAFYATLEYVSSDTLKTEIPAIIIKDLINDIASEFNLDLKIEPDFGALETYCDNHKIDIPQEVSNIMAVGNIFWR